MEYKPILFNTDMVRAIQEGRKTQTRRVIRPQPLSPICYIMAGSHHGKWNYMDEKTADAWDMADKLPIGGIPEEEKKRLWTPPCHTDDILWVRETWCRLYYNDPDGYTHYDQPMYYYFADGRPDIELRDDDGRTLDDQRIRWRPSIHMPKEAARIFLRVTNVRVDRLKNITEKEIRAEGEVDSCCMCSFNLGYDAHEINCGKNIHRAVDCPLHMLYPDIGFFGLWDCTIKPEERKRYGWQANPWVWVITFERTDKPKNWAERINHGTDYTG